jgi:drug/metabolite transporter (DMT)-like permease
MITSLPAPVALPRRVAARIGPLAAGYAFALAVLERLLPIKPSWVVLEVVGGVLLVGLPVMDLAREARRSGISLSWETYEAMVAAGFVAAGTPIILWQMLENMVRQGSHH